MQTASELMTPNPIKVRVDTPVPVCAQLLSRHDIRHLPVVDEQGRLYGVVSDFTVFQAGGLLGERQSLWVFFDPDDTRSTATDFAAPVHVLAGLDDDLSGVLSRMSVTRQDLAVVIDDDEHPIGIITEHDGVRLACAVLSPELLVSHEATSPVHVVQAGRSANVALDLMLTYRIRHVAVVDGDQLVGVLSYRDLVASDVPGGRSRPSRDIIRRHEVHFVRAGTPLVEAARTMVRHKIGCLPLVDARFQPVAMITRTDVIGALVEALDQESLFPAEVG